MRYIIVNQRTPKGLARYCKCCLAKIEDGYTRDMDLKILYCSPMCLEVDVYEARVAMGAYDAPMKFLPQQKGGSV